MEGEGDGNVVGKERIENRQACASIVFPLDRQLEPMERARRIDYDANMQSRRVHKMERVVQLFHW